MSENEIGEPPSVDLYGLQAQAREPRIDTPGAYAAGLAELDIAVEFSRVDVGAPGQAFA